MRKLASVQKIIDISPIAEADNIELATVLGWKTIVRKSDFKVGDLCVYCEVDSILPESNPNFEFLRQRCYSAKWKGFRIKTMKLRGQVSQGIIFPLSILPQNKQYEEGEDVTEILGIVKYDPEALEENKLLENQQKKSKHSQLWYLLMSFKTFRRIYHFVNKCLGRQKKSHNFPPFIPQTDETRLQTIWKDFVRVCSNPDNTFYITEKLDGQSATYFLRKKKIGTEAGVCSRKIWLRIPDFSNYWQIERQYKIIDSLKRNKLYDIAIQGEIIGEGIQGNNYKIKGLDFYVFNIYDINKRKYLPYEDVLQITQFLGLKMVPMIEVYKQIAPNDFNSIDDFFKYIDEHKYSALNPDSIIEGIVIRTTNQKFSAKVINPQYEMKGQ